MKSATTTCESGSELTRAVAFARAVSNRLEAARIRLAEGEGVAELRCVSFALRHVIMAEVVGE